MSAPPFIQLYTGDYLADTFHLSTVEHGAYLLLIMMYWRRGEALADDDRYLASIARMPLRSWRNIKSTLAQFFTVDAGYWIHKRIETDLQSVRDTSVKRSIAGQISASKRKAMAEDSHSLKEADTVMQDKALSNMTTELAGENWPVKNELDTVKQAVNNVGAKKAKTGNRRATKVQQASNKNSTKISISDIRYQISDIRYSEDNINHNTINELNNNDFPQKVLPVAEKKSAFSDNADSVYNALNTNRNTADSARVEPVDNVEESAVQSTLPPWLPADSWMEFVSHRQSMQKPLTVLSEKKIMAALEKLKETGNNIKEVLETSIMNGWAGVFPVRKSAKSSSVRAKKTESTAWKSTLIAEDNKQSYRESSGKF